MIDFSDGLIAVFGSVITGTVGWVAKRAQDTNNTITEHDKRLALVEQSFEDLKELINTRFDGVEQRFDSSDQRVSRVERSLNGFLRHE